MHIHNIIYKYFVYKNVKNLEIYRYIIYIEILYFKYIIFFNIALQIKLIFINGYNTMHESPCHV